MVTDRDLLGRHAQGTRPGIRSGLRALRAVLRTALLAVLDALRVEGAAHDVVAHARQVLHAAAADQHHRVLLQVVALAADVRDDLEAVGQAHLGHLAKGRVRLLRRGGVHTRADAPLLRAVLQRRALALDGFDLARLAHELVDGRHTVRFLDAKASRKRLAELNLSATGVRRAAGLRRVACVAREAATWTRPAAPCTVERLAAAAGKERSARAGAEKLAIIASRASGCQGKAPEPSLGKPKEKGPPVGGPDSSSR